MSRNSPWYKGVISNSTKKVVSVEFLLFLCYNRPTAMAQILIINGSISGSAGNTAELLALAEERLTEQGHSVDDLELVRDPSRERLIDQA